VASGTFLQFNNKEINRKIIDLDDFPNVNIFKHLEASYLFIEENLKKTNVLVHGFVGVSRSASCVIAYIMKK
jgi:dual specificity phosphatase 12